MVKYVAFLRGIPATSSRSDGPRVPSESARHHPCPAQSLHPPKPTRFHALFPGNSHGHAVPPFGDTDYTRSTMMAAQPGVGMRLGG